MATIAKQTIYLNLRPGSVMPVLHVSQGDSGLEVLEFKLINGSQPWSIPAAVTDIQLNGTTPVGVFSYSDPTWSGNTVTANVTETMTAERGLTLCELRLLDSTLNSIGTLNFVIAVEPSPFTNAHVSTSDMAVITESLNGSQRNMLLSKSWAVGDTGMRDGEDTNNSKYWSEVSDDNGQRWATGTVDGAAVPSTDPAYHNNSKYWSEQSDINGERWSVGKINGSDVPTSDETYHNNSKWWSSISESWAVGGTGNRTGEDINNSKYWSEQSNINGERWSVGQENGTDVPSTDPTYHNNSKYWSTISHQYANEVSYKKVYETVAEMKADSALIDGQICRTLGYYAANDGGGALYQMHTTQPTTYNENITNGLYAELILPEAVTPEMFGAKGDGVTDDYAALNAAFQTGKDVIGKPTAYYKCTDTIESQDCKYVRGLKVTLAPDHLIKFNASKFLMENCEFDHGADFMTIEERGEFLIGCYGDTVDISSSYFHDTVSAIFCGYEQKSITVRGCHFKNCKESLDALTRGVNGYAIVTDAAVNVYVFGNLFEDVYRHSVYISMSDITTQTPTKNAIIANNVFIAHDRNSDRYVTEFEVPIMLRNPETVKVSDNVFVNMFGGCVTLGGSYTSGYTDVDFINNAVIKGYNGSREQYGAINMIASKNDGNRVSVRGNSFRECAYPIINADKSSAIELCDNDIDTTKVAIITGYTNRTEQSGMINASNNTVKNATAIVASYGVLGKTTVSGNSYMKENGSFGLVSNSGQAQSSNLVIMSENKSVGYIAIHSESLKNVVFQRNNAFLRSTVKFDNDANVRFSHNSNINTLNLTEASSDTLVITGVTGNNVQDMLKTVLSQWASDSALVSDTTYTVSIRASGSVQGQYNGTINVTDTAIRFMVATQSEAYLGYYVKASDTITVNKFITSVNADRYKTTRLVATNTGQDVTITFASSGHHMAIIAERFNSVTLVFFNGVSVYTLAIVGTAHTCTFVNDHAFKFTAQHSARALVIADEPFSNS